MNLSTYQECFIEFKSCWILLQQLVDSIQPLDKHWTSFIHVIMSWLMTATFAKLVAKVKPLPLHKDLKALH